MKVFTFAWDDDNGTGCSVHATERERDIAFIDHIAELAGDGNEEEIRTEAMRVLDEEDGDLWEYLEEHFQMLATYNCDDQELAVGAPPTKEQLLYIETAREMVAGGCHFDADDIEIDDGPASDGSYPKTSEVDGEGSWVQAWVWVSNMDAGIGEVAEG